MYVGSRGLLQNQGGADPRKWDKTRVVTGDVYASSWSVCSETWLLTEIDFEKQKVFKTIYQLNLK